MLLPGALIQGGNKSAFRQEFYVVDDLVLIAEAHQKCFIFLGLSEEANTRYK